MIQKIILDNDHGSVASQLTSMASHEHHRASDEAMVIIQDNFLDYPLDGLLFVIHDNACSLHVQYGHIENVVNGNERASHECDNQKVNLLN